MRQFEAEIRTKIPEELRLKLNRQPARALLAPAGPLVIFLVVIVVYSGSFYHPRSGDSTQATTIQGVPVHGSHVLALVDISRSLEGHEAARDAQLGQLKEAALRVNGISGFGVRSGGAGDNLLNSLESGLKADPDIDTVYVFSDFYTTPEYSNSWEVDGSDAAGYERLLYLIRDRRLRLYLSTVNLTPSAELLSIARESGGDLINTK